MTSRQDEISRLRSDALLKRRCGIDRRDDILKGQYLL